MNFIKRKFNAKLSVPASIDSPDNESRKSILTLNCDVNAPAHRHDMDDTDVTSSDQLNEVFLLNILSPRH